MDYSKTLFCYPVFHRASRCHRWNREISLTLSVLMTYMDVFINK